MGKGQSKVAPTSTVYNDKWFEERNKRLAAEEAERKRNRIVQPMEGYGMYSSGFEVSQLRIGGHNAWANIHPSAIRNQSPNPSPPPYTPHRVFVRGNLVRYKGQQHYGHLGGYDSEFDVMELYYV